jgi:hypothetical protein
MNAFHIFQNSTFVIVLPCLSWHCTYVDLTFLRLAAPLISNETDMATADVISVVG